MLHRVRRHLHGWTAVLVAMGFVIAWLMTALPMTRLLEKFVLYQVHKTIGLTVLGLTAARLVLAWRARDFGGAVKRGLYGLLLIVPVLGYWTAETSPTPVPVLVLPFVTVPRMMAPDAAVFDVVRALHEGFAIGLVVLAVWHGVWMTRRYWGRVGRPL